MASNGSGRRPSAATFRRRRLTVAVVVLVLVVILLGGVIALIRAAGASTASGGAAAGASPTAGVTASPGGTASVGSTGAPTSSASPTPSSSTTVACDPSRVTLEASTDKSVYASGENPLLTLKVVNGNPVPCEVNVGTSQMEFVITSGNDRVFSSKDCQVEPSDNKKRLAANATDTANFPWGRVRSTPGCSTVKVQPRPGFYRLETRLGDRTSGQVVFQLQ